MTTAISSAKRNGHNHATLAIQVLLGLRIELVAAPLTTKRVVYILVWLHV